MGNRMGASLTGDGPYTPCRAAKCNTTIGHFGEGENRDHPWQEIMPYTVIEGQRQRISIPENFAQAKLWWRQLPARQISREGLGDEASLSHFLPFPFSSFSFSFYLPPSLSLSFFFFLLRNPNYFMPTNNPQHSITDNRADTSPQWLSPSRLGGFNRRWWRRWPCGGREACEFRLNVWLQPRPPLTVGG